MEAPSPPSQERYIVTIIIITDMKKRTLDIRHYGMLLILVLCSISSYAQVIGDSVVAVANNWNVGEYAIYKNYSGRIRIEGGDTITEHEEPVTLTKVLLKEVLPNEDKVFVITTEATDSITTEENTPQDDQEELRALFRKLNETPVTILTDFSGEVKDIYDYDSLRVKMDSCFNQVITKIKAYDLPEEIEEGLTGNMKRMWDQAATKESLMARCDLFRYYGYNYPIGMSTEHIKVPLLSEDNKVDATRTFSCEPVETESGVQLIELTSMTSYDSDQVMDGILSSVIGQKMTLNREPDSPYVSMNVTEQFLFDPETGTVVEYVIEKKANSQDKTIIEYSISEWD